MRMRWYLVTYAIKRDVVMVGTGAVELELGRTPANSAEIRELGDHITGLGRLGRGNHAEVLGWSLMGD